MLQNENAMQDPEMQREMERFREHMGGMTQQMEEALQSMERARERLRQQTPDS